MVFLKVWNHGIGSEEHLTPWNLIDFPTIKTFQLPCEPFVSPRPWARQFCRACDGQQRSGAALDHRVIEDVDAQKQWVYHGFTMVYLFKRYPWSSNDSSYLAIVTIAKTQGSSLLGFSMERFGQTSRFCSNSRSLCLQFLRGNTSPELVVEEWLNHVKLSIFAALTR